VVHSLIAPLIVKRQGIIPKRAELIYNAVDVIAQAHRERPQHSHQTVGSYHVDHKDKKGTQDIFPLGHSARTVSEYTDFLIHIAQEASWKLPSFEGDLLTTIANREVYQDRERIKKQVERDASNLVIRTGDQGLNFRPELAWEEISLYLKNADIDEETCWKILCSCNQTVGVDIARSLESIFKNDALGASLIVDSSRKVELDIHAKDGVASLTLVAYYQIVDQNRNVINRIKGTTSIPDHRSGIVECSFSIVH
jgi:hypothetical protein